MNVIPANIVELAKLCDRESTRYALAGVSIKVTDGKYECCATDTRRLAIVRGECEKEEEESSPRRFRAIVGPKTHRNPKLKDASPEVSAIIGAGDLKRAAAIGVGKPKDKLLGLNQNGVAVAIAVDSQRSVEVPIVEGRFPKYLDVLPSDEPKMRLFFDASLLAETLSLATKYAEYPKRTTVVLEIRDAEQAIVIKLSGSSAGKQEFIGLVMPVQSVEKPK